MTQTTKTFQPSIYETIKAPLPDEYDDKSIDSDKKSISQETLPLMKKDATGPKKYLETSLDDVADDDVPKKKYLETSLDNLDSR